MYLALTRRGPCMDLTARARPRSPVPEPGHTAGRGSILGADLHHHRPGTSKVNGRYIRECQFRSYNGSHSADVLAAVLTGSNQVLACSAIH